jgi:hypothetical protein
MLGASIGKAAPQTLLGSQRGFVKCVRGRRLRANHKSCLVGVELEVGLGRVPRFLARAMSAKRPVQVDKSRAEQSRAEQSRAEQSRAEQRKAQQGLDSTVGQQGPVEHLALCSSADGKEQTYAPLGYRLGRARTPSLSGSLYPATTSQDKDSVIVSWPAFLDIRVHAAISSEGMLAMGVGKERDPE